MNLRKIHKWSGSPKSHLQLSRPPKTKTKTKELLPRDKLVSSCAFICSMPHQSQRCRLGCNRHYSPGHLLVQHPSKQPPSRNPPKHPGWGSQNLLFKTSLDKQRRLSFNKGKNTKWQHITNVLSTSSQKFEPLTQNIFLSLSDNKKH